MHAAARSLTPFLGFFGGAHSDDHNAAAAVICMLPYVEAPDGSNPGVFHLVELGGFVRMSSMLCVCFRGRSHHGGTAVVLPEGVHSDNGAVRATYILYPPEIPFSGSALVALCSLPRGGLLSMRPEMTNVWYSDA